MTARTTPDPTASGTIAGAARRFDDLTGTVFAGHHRPLLT
jgi:hypothetical protein